MPCSIRSISLFVYLGQIWKGYNLAFYLLLKEFHESFCLCKTVYLGGAFKLQCNGRSEPIRVEVQGVPFMMLDRSTSGTWHIPIYPNVLGIKKYDF